MKSKVRGRGRGRAILSCDKTELNNAEKVTSKGVDVTFKSDQESTQMDTPKPSADTEQDDERKNQFAFDTESNMLQHIGTSNYLNNLILCYMSQCLYVVPCSIPYRMLITSQAIYLKHFI